MAVIATLTQVTTLPRQNYQIHFGFGKNITVFPRVLSELGVFQPGKVLKSMYVQYRKMFAMATFIYNL